MQDKKKNIYFENKLPIESKTDRENIVEEKKGIKIIKAYYFQS